MHDTLQNGIMFVSDTIRDNINENVSIIKTQAARIETFARFALGNLNYDKRKRKLLHIPQIATRIFKSFDLSLREKNIIYNLEFADKIDQCKGFEIDWESIFVNLLTNSIWAIVNNAIGTPRIIRLKISQNRQALNMQFADSGKGLEAGTEDKIFLPTFSTKRNLSGELIGTGLGLTIIKNFIDTYNGATIDVKSPCDLGGAAFNIIIPLNE